MHTSVRASAATTIKLTKPLKMNLMQHGMQEPTWPQVLVRIR
eukprot:CAMPEP_0181282320 /NCGR_PEP_ID=MMETSP1097-20121128/14119_1 /TAXON_ID=35684 /ORGANISM="Pseudopedinella elastica, Strain CCMP716" /LENGTH=41 /DNA_ID= /DNA_START= /DNA_END= /DNA_ORIENTATION=